MTAAITPFTLAIPQSDLDDLQQRLANTRWPDQLPGVGWTYGTPRDYLRGLADYWQHTYDWRAHEARLNQIPQFTTEIDGANVHFLHLRSPEPNALPIILTHGWPGSIVEFLALLGPLTDPRAHGGDPADAFHVVIPSIPGFGLSGPTTDTGWSSQRVARAFAELMQRLGYARYGAQGGDLGAIVSPELGRLNPDKVVGVHVNSGSVGFIPLGPIDAAELAELTDLEKSRLAKIEHFRTDEWGYNLIQSTRPQTLAYGLTDSPVGQLGWIVEKFKAWTAESAELPEDAVDRDDLLTNVMLYWLTGTAGSSARIYYEDTHGEWSFPRSSGVPTGVAVFAQDVSIRRFAERSNNIVHWSDIPSGGHFAALETPQLLIDDMRTFFRLVR